MLLTDHDLLLWWSW